MRASLFVFALTSAVILSACGGGAPGDACDTDGFLCSDEVSAMECRGGKWRLLPCRGPKGCIVAGSKVTCDMSRNVAGDACAEETEGHGLCNATNNGTLVCRQGTIIAQDVCTTCIVSGDRIDCQKD